MIKNIKILVLFFFIILNFDSKSIADEFYFEGNEIEILNNGNRLISNKGVKITSADNIVITAEEFDYNKLKSELLLNGNIIINDIDNKTIIKTNKIKYLKNKEEIYTYGESEIDIEEKYSFKSKDVVFFREKKEIKSNFKTIIIDNDGNNFITEKFLFLLEDKTLKGEKVILKDIAGNKTSLESFFGSLKNKEFFGKDVKVNFDNKSFGNAENEPRMYGNTLKTNQNESVISKGIFTTCKKRKGCPPWTIKAKEIHHDKKKKIINYRNAWLEVYDRPIIYFPKFFHPDPTVKRQSGFLIPRFTDSGNTGTSIQIPYFKVLDINKDMTIKPRLFTNQSLILQSEYREVEKNYTHIMDFSIFTSILSNKHQTSKSHFYSNTVLDLENSFFEDSTLNVNLEQTTNDTYLKKYKINSPLIKSETLMHSFLQYDGYGDTSSLNLSVETYEDLTKNTHDRYEVIFPNIKYSKNLDDALNLNGSLNLNSSVYQKQYETNKYEQSFINNFSYSSPSKFKENGLVTDYKLSLINPNERKKTGSKNESNSKSQLLSKFMYSMSYPLKKETDLYNNFLTPTLSYRFSPNITKNISNADRRLDASTINSFERISESGAVEGGTKFDFWS